MTCSLYDAVIPSNLQILRAVDRLVDKAEAHCAAEGIAPEMLIEARLADDMLPFGYQVKSCAVHSLGAIEGVRGGSFSPDTKPWPRDFTGLHALLRDAATALEAIDRETLDALAGQGTEFLAGETRLPFTGVQFLLSFSQPNFYFHASIAYAILRNRGVKLGKRDFLGALRFAR